MLSVPGVRPEQADGFARALLGPEAGPGDERRAAALVGWLLERAALQGHTALESDAVRAALAERSVPDPDEALQSAVADGAVLVFQDALDTAPGAPAAQEAGHDGHDDVGSGSEDEAAPQPVRVLLGLDRYALAEESLADGLARLVNASALAPGGEQADWEQAAADAPSPSAAELIRTVARNGLVAHTGGEAARSEPAAVVTAARALGLRAYAAAHTPDGRRRLAAALDDPAAAVTVSGLLTGSEGPGRDGEGALALDLLAVVDAPSWMSRARPYWSSRWPTAAAWSSAGIPGCSVPPVPGRCSPMSSRRAPARSWPPAPPIRAPSASWSRESGSAS